ncbi:MAG: DUF3857 domain-containing protein [Bacteroidota bacterium]
MRSLILLFLCIGLCGYLAAQFPASFAASAIPTSLREHAESVIRYESQSFRLQDDDQATIELERVVTILDPDSDAHQLYVFYGPDTRVVDFDAVLYDANGEKIRKARNSEITDGLAVGGASFYVDSRYKAVDLQHGQLPYTVHLKYKLAAKDVGLFRNMPRWSPLDFDQSCQYAELIISHPANNPIYTETNRIGEPEQEVENDRRTWRWKLEDLPARQSEWGAPPSLLNLPYVMAGFHSFEMEGYTGSYQSWGDFGSFLYDLNEGRQELPDELRQEVISAVADANSNAEKIALLYRFLQDRTRYVSVQLGIGGWQPFSAEYVEQNRYGDCKALSNYMRSILDAIGINSYPVIIQAGNRPYYEVHEAFVTNAFNHQILYVPEEDMYLECTSSTAPPGYLGDWTADRTVLLLTPEGGQLARTPQPLASDNAAIQTIDLQLADDGSVELSLQGEYHGSRQDMLRGIADAMSTEEQLEYLHKNGYLPAVSEVDYELIIEADEPTASLQYRCELDRYARRMGQRLFLPINRFFAYDQVPPADTKREMPIHLRTARLLVDTIRIELPENMEMESMGTAATNFSHARGDYRSELSQEGNVLTWVRVLRLNPVELPAEAYAELRDFYVEIGKADGRQVVLKERRTR